MYTHMDICSHVYVCMFYVRRARVYVVGAAVLELLLNLSATVELGAGWAEKEKCKKEGRGATQLMWC